MNEDDLDRLERDTGLKLPARYRAILLNYPQELIDMADVYPNKKGPPTRVGPETAELYNDPELLRLRNITDARYRNEIFPPQFFTIGDSGCGDYYAIDTTDENAAVYMSGCHHAPPPFERFGDKLIEVESPGPPDFHELMESSIEKWVERLIRTAPKKEPLRDESNPEFRREQALKNALSEAEEAFRSKDYGRVVRLLSPFEGELQKAQALKVELARKMQIKRGF